jgi:hypothetical protein
MVTCDTGENVASGMLNIVASSFPQIRTAPVSIAVLALARPFPEFASNK